MSKRLPFPIQLDYEVKDDHEHRIFVKWKDTPDAVPKKWDTTIFGSIKRD